MGGIYTQCLAGRNKAQACWLPTNVKIQKRRFTFWTYVRAEFSTLQHNEVYSESKGCVTTRRFYKEEASSPVALVAFRLPQRYTAAPTILITNPAPPTFAA